MSTLTEVTCSIFKKFSRFNNELFLILKKGIRASRLEFDIRFLSTNSDPTIGGFVDNEFIPKISRCVINSISVDYTPQGIFTTFEDNAPVAITLTLNMTELQIILRDQIESGY